MTKAKRKNRRGVVVEEWLVDEILQHLEYYADEREGGAEHDEAKRVRSNLCRLYDAKMKAARRA